MVSGGAGALQIKEGPMFVEAGGALQAGLYVENVKRGCLDVVEDPWKAQTRA